MKMLVCIMLKTANNFMEDKIMKKKETKKVKKLSRKDVKQAYLELVNSKIMETNGLYAGTKEFCDAANSTSNLYKVGMEADIREREAAIHLADTLFKAACMSADIAINESNVNTALALSKKYYTGDGEFQKLRGFSVRKYLK